MWRAIAAAAALLAIVTLEAGAQQDCGISVIVRFGFSSPPAINPPSGVTIMLTCFPTNQDEYTWQRNGQELASEMSSTLSVGEGGVFRCGVVLPQCGILFSINDISVNTLPVITQATASANEVEEGESFILSCAAIGWPLPSTQWVLDGGTIVGAGPNLTVLAATPQDSGSYTCSASNLRGTVTSPAVDITVGASATPTASLPQTTSGTLPTQATTEPDLATTEPATTEPGLATTQPSVATTEPGLATTEPGLATTDPTTEPSLATTEPGLATTEPSLAVATNASVATTELTEDALVLLVVMCAVAALLLSITIFTISCCCYHEVCKAQSDRKCKRRATKPPVMDKVELLPTHSRKKRFAGTNVSPNRQSSQSHDMAKLSCVNMAFGQEGTDAGSDASAQSSLKNLAPPQAVKTAKPHRPRSEVLVAKTGKLGPQRYSLPSRPTGPEPVARLQKPLSSHQQKHQLPPVGAPNTVSMDDPRVQAERPRKKQAYSEGRLRRPLSFRGFGKKSSDTKEKSLSKSVRPVSKPAKAVSTAASKQEKREKEKKNFFRRSKAITTSTTERAGTAVRKPSGPVLQQVLRTDNEVPLQMIPTELPLSMAESAEPTVTTLQEWGTPANSVTISEKTGETTVAMEQDGDSVASEEEEEKEEEEVDGDDQTQLIPDEPSGIKDAPPTSHSELASRLGRRESFVQKLTRSRPLSVSEITHLAYGEEDLQPSHPLWQEYNSVPFNSVQTLDQSLAEKQKNRYRNVLPNPHSAVKLCDTGDDGSSYINANFIRGVSGQPNSYIATQGPIIETVDDFWRMVWEHEVTIIVMITALVERGKHKCVKYWPAANSSSATKYGEVLVGNNFEEKTSNYKITYLSVSDVQQRAAPRDVYHFSCTAWPDFGVPQSSDAILSLQDVVASYRHSPSCGPVVVHCSAGLGRSGMFMAVDMGVEQFKEEGVVDPLRYMCQLRQDRGGMIQTPEQYLYIHKALADFMVTRP